MRDNRGPVEGELSSECGASCLGASCLWGELSVIHFRYALVVDYRIHGYTGHSCSECDSKSSS